MKLYKLFGFLFIITAGANGQTSSTMDSSYANSHYVQRLAFFKKMPDQKHEIVFLGNSITEQGEWQELSREEAVVNRGISGDVTFGVLARLDEVLSSKPFKIFILIGINDLKRGIPENIIITNYSRIIKRIKHDSPRTGLIIQSILPVNESMLPVSYQKLSNEKIKKLNLLLVELAKSHDADFIDLHPIFSNKEGQLNKEITSDGIHLKAIAYIQWVQYLKQKKLL